jgi:hypothetical protein
LKGLGKRCVFSEKDPLSEQYGKGSEISCLHDGIEVMQDWIVFILDSSQVSLPSAPSSLFFVFGLLLDSM